MIISRLILCFICKNDSIEITKKKYAPTAFKMVSMVTNFMNIYSTTTFPINSDWFYTMVTMEVHVRNT